MGDEYKLWMNIIFKRCIGISLIFLAVSFVAIWRPESIRIFEWFVALGCSVIVCGGFFILLWDV